MCSSFTILCIILFVINVSWLISFLRNKKLKKDELNRLKQEPENKNKSIKELADEIEPRQWYTWVFSSVLCLDIWLLGAIFTHLWAGSFFNDVQENDSRKALFGDSFGAVNALVSAFAFAGMIVSFFMQRTELRLQRKELQENRQEMAQQTAQFAAENRNLEIQRFENLFYNMLNLQQKIVDGLKYKDMNPLLIETKPEEVAGREVFRHLYNEVEVGYYGVNQGNGYRDYLQDYGTSGYNDISIPSYFDHYFRHLYKILQFVDSKVRTTNDKDDMSRFLSFDEAYKYVSFLRGTLSRYELVWIYYNALMPEYFKFKDLIERYSFLKNLRPELLTTSKEAKEYYDTIKIDPKCCYGTCYCGNDFEYYLTTEINPSKYHISAFWNRTEIEKGVAFVAGWPEFVQRNANQN